MKMREKRVSGRSVTKSVTDAGTDARTSVVELTMKSLDCSLSVCPVRVCSSSVNAEGLAELVDKLPQCFQGAFAPLVDAYRRSEAQNEFLFLRNMRLESEVEELEEKVNKVVKNDVQNLGVMIDSSCCLDVGMTAQQAADLLASVQAERDSLQQQLSVMRKSCVLPMFGVESETTRSRSLSANSQNNKEETEESLKAPGLNSVDSAVTFSKHVTELFETNFNHITQHTIIEKVYRLPVARSSVSVEPKMHSAPRPTAPEKHIQHEPNAKMAKSGLPPPADSEPCPVQFFNPYEMNASLLVPGSPPKSQYLLDPFNKGLLVSLGYARLADTLAVSRTLKAKSLAMQAKAEGIGMPGPGLKGVS